MPIYDFEIEYDRTVIIDSGWFNIIQALLVEKEISDARHNGSNNNQISLTVETKSDSSLSRSEVWTLIQGMVFGTELTETS